MIISSLAIVSSFQLFSQDQADRSSENITPLEHDSQSVSFESIHASASSFIRFEKIEQIFSAQDQWKDFW